MNIGQGKTGLVYGVGYCSTNLPSKTGGKFTRQYTTWANILKRSYSPKYHEINPTYRSVTLDTEWHDYQNFYDWYNHNYYELQDEVVHLDKDILVKGNKIYGPNTCAFVPRSINSLLTKRDSKRGKYKIGVHFHKPRNKFRAQLSIDGIETHIGLFDTEEEAYLAYKRAKEHEIKRMASLYKEYLRNDVYEALTNYKVSEED